MIQKQNNINLNILTNFFGNGKIRRKRIKHSDKNKVKDFDKDIYYFSDGSIESILEKKNDKRNYVCYDNVTVGNKKYRKIVKILFEDNNKNRSSNNYSIAFDNFSGNVRNYEDYDGNSKISINFFGKNNDLITMDVYTNFGKEGIILLRGDIQNGLYSFIYKYKDNSKKYLLPEEYIDSSQGINFSVETDKNGNGKISFAITTDFYKNNQIKRGLVYVKYDMKNFKIKNINDDLHNHINFPKYFMNDSLRSQELTFERILKILNKINNEEILIKNKSMKVFSRVDEVVNRAKYINETNKYLLKRRIDNDKIYNRLKNALSSIIDKFKTRIKNK